jgi:hypothetical protein
MVSRERLKEVLSYCADTGLFTWRVAVSRKVRVGAIAGGKSGDGQYIHIRLDGRIYRAHRLAWLYMTGEFPATLIDHDDGNGCNNRWTNLRLATSTENGCNRGKTRANTSGFKGVFRCLRTGKWYAQIRYRGRAKRLGTYETTSEAHEVYCLWADLLHKDFANYGERKYG